MDIQDIEEVRSLIVFCYRLLQQFAIMMWKNVRAMCWSFKMGIGAVSDKDWHKFYEGTEQIMII